MARPVRKSLGCACPGDWRRPWSDSNGPAWWVDVVANSVVGDDRKPAIGAWYLVPEDFPEPICEVDEPDDLEDTLSDRLVDWVLQQRREYPVPSDLSLEPVSQQARQQDITLEQIGQETTYEDIASRHDVPRSITPWLRKDASTRQNYIQICELVAENEFRSYAQLFEVLDVDWTESTVRVHASKDDGLDPCLERDGQVWTLTPAGQRVLDIDWGAVETGLQEVGK